jgi:hypothetical protein
VRTLLFWLGLVFGGAAGGFYWASNYGTGWAAALCNGAPVSCTNWQTFVYAAGVMMIGYLVMALTS